MYILLRNTQTNLTQLEAMRSFIDGTPDKKYLQLFPNKDTPACYLIGSTKIPYFESLVSELDVTTAINKYRLLQSLGITNQDELASLLRE